jgi:hypothetical protein
MPSKSLKMDILYLDLKGANNFATLAKRLGLRFFNKRN